jgi:hypothetical protein
MKIDVYTSVLFDVQHEQVSLILAIYVCCDTEGSILVLSKRSRLRAYLDSIYHYTSVLYASVEVDGL